MFFVQKSTFTQSNNVSCVRDLLVLFSVSGRQKVTITENIAFADCVWNPTSRLFQIGEKFEKWQWRHNFLTWRHQIFLRFLFLLSSLVTGPSFMSISSLVLELWNFGNFFIRDWPEIRNTEKPTSEFCPVSGDWNQLWIPNLARMSLIECYWMLQNSRVIAFSVFELLRENQLGGVTNWLVSIWR